MAEFDIIEYLSGLTGFVFDKSVLKRIALDRGVSDIRSYSDLDSRTKELLRADLLYTAYLSPDVIASSTKQHGSYTQTVGSQTVYDRRWLYNSFITIYHKYDDEKLEAAESSDGGLQWLE